MILHILPFDFKSNHFHLYLLFKFWRQWRYPAWSCQYALFLKVYGGWMISVPVLPRLFQSSLLQLSAPVAPEFNYFSCYLYSISFHFGSGSCRWFHFSIILDSCCFVVVFNSFFSACESGGTCVRNPAGRKQEILSTPASIFLVLSLLLSMFFRS